MFIIHNDNHNIYVHITIKGLNPTIKKIQALMT